MALSGAPLTARPGPSYYLERFRRDAAAIKGQIAEATMRPAGVATQPSSEAVIGRGCAPGTSQSSGTRWRGDATVFAGRSVGDRVRGLVWVDASARSATNRRQPPRTSVHSSRRSARTSAPRWIGSRARVRPRAARTALLAVEEIQRGARAGCARHSLHDERAVLASRAAPLRAVDALGAPALRGARLAGALRGLAVVRLGELFGLHGYALRTRTP
jgi:hypothetical protein